MHEPKFLRGDVATILGCSKLTIRNREQKGKYPPPSRDLNGYRVYDLNDIFNLQLITFGKIDHRPIMSVMYDMGITDMKEQAKLLDSVTAKRTGKYS